MNRYLVISIDVEPDCHSDWRYSSPLTFNGVSEGIVKRLQPLFNKYQLAPTYLINNVVLEDKNSCKSLASLDGRYELGTHLHPEFIEPQKTVFDYAGKKGEANCCFLDPAVELEKIRSITRLFAQRFNYSPVSFRAGRFSAGPNTIQSLATLKYKVDTSVTPHVNWNDSTRERPVDYSNFPEQPYFMKPTSMKSEDVSGSILQVPVTITEKRTSIIRELKRTYFGLRHKIKSYRPVWLRPVFSSFNDFAVIVAEFEDRYKINEMIVYNMMFHNVEVMPGLSPYTRTENDCKRYLDDLEKFFIYCKQNNISGATLNDVYNLYR
jgi:hypothetical protein